MCDNEIDLDEERKRVRLLLPLKLRIEIYVILCPFISYTCRWDLQYTYYQIKVGKIGNRFHLHVFISVLGIIYFAWKRWWNLV